MAFNSVINLQYHYSSRDETKLENTLAALEADLGGERRPRSGRTGVIDLITYLEFVLAFVAGATLGEVLKSYFAGLAGAEKAKALGERHQKILVKWFHDMQKNLHRLISSVRLQLQEGLRVPRFED